MILGPAERSDFSGLPDFDDRYNQSLKILPRDLDVWSALSAKSGFSLRVILQPILNWMPKTQSPEEQELLEIMEQVGFFGGGMARSVP